jgi:hypothetical protein
MVNIRARVNKKEPKNPKRRQPAFCMLCNREFTRLDEVERHWRREQNRHGVHRPGWSRAQYCIKTADLESLLRQRGWTLDLDTFLTWYLGFLGKYFEAGNESKTLTLT